MHEREHAVHDARRGPPEVRAVTANLPIPDAGRGAQAAGGRERGGARVDAHVHQLLGALAVLRGFLEGEDGVHGVAAVAEGGARHRRLAVLVLRHVEQGGEEEEDAEGDGHDVSRELTAGVDGRAACVRGKIVGRRVVVSEAASAGEIFSRGVSGARGTRSVRGRGAMDGRVPRRGTLSEFISNVRCLV